MLLAPIVAIALAASAGQTLTFNEDCRIVGDGHVLFDGVHVDHGCIAVVPRDTAAHMVGQCEVAEAREGCEFSLEGDDAKFSQAPGTTCAFTCTAGGVPKPASKK